MNTQPGKATVALVNFGPAYAGLATVGYTLKNPDGTVHVARTTTSVHDAGQGYYDVTVTEAAEWEGYIEWDTGETTPVYAREEWNVQAVSATQSLEPSVQAELDAIKAKTDLIGTGTVTGLIPVLADGSLALIAGDDYLLVDGRQIDFTSNSWPDLTGASVKLHFVGGFNKTGTVVTPTGTAKVRFELTKTDTADIPNGLVQFAVVATLADASVVTLMRGKATVTA